MGKVGRLFIGPTLSDALKVPQLSEKRVKGQRWGGRAGRTEVGGNERSEGEEKVVMTIGKPICVQAAVGRSACSTVDGQGPETLDGGGNECKCSPPSSLGCMDEEITGLLHLRAGAGGPLSSNWFPQSAFIPLLTLRQVEHSSSNLATYRINSLRAKRVDLM